MSKVTKADSYYDIDIILMYCPALIEKLFQGREVQTILGYKCCGLCYQYAVRNELNMTPSSLLSCILLSDSQCISQHVLSLDCECLSVFADSKCHPECQIEIIGIKTATKMETQMEAGFNDQAETPHSQIQDSKKLYCFVYCEYFCMR